MRRLAALADVALTRSDLTTLLYEITEIVKTLLPPTQASLIMWDPDRQQFNLSASTMPTQEPRYVLDEVRDRGGASRWIIDERKHLAMPDIELDPFGASPMLRDAGLRAYLGVPVLFEEEALGVLYALEDTPTRVLPDRRRLHEHPRPQSLDCDRLRPLVRAGARAGADR